MKKIKLKKDKVVLVVVGLFFVFLMVFGLYKAFDRYISLNSMTIILEVDQIDLNENDTFLLDAKCSLSKYNDEILWESSDNKIVEVEHDGTIKGIMPGKAEVKAFVKGADSVAKCVVTVLKTIKLESISLTDSVNQSLYLGTNIDLGVKLYPENTTQKNLEFSISNNKIVEVSKNGVLKTKGIGKFVLTVLEKSSNKKIEKEIEIIENPGFIKNVSFQFNKDLLLQSGQKLKLKPIFNPENIKNKTLQYSSNNRNIVDVSTDGTVVAKSTGEAIITCVNDYSKYKKKFKVTVKNDDGFITKKLLDASGAMNARKLMIVAHPDDETLWGGGHLLEGNWFVVCLTNGNNAARSREFDNALAISKSKHIILSYPDLRSKKVKDNWDYDKGGITKDIERVLNYKNWDQVVTHNPNGEYGHIHHKMTNKFTLQVSSKLGVFNKLYYFGEYYPLGKVPATVTKNITGNIYTNKLRMIDAFTTQRSAILHYWEQMLPYEHWIKATNW